MKWLEKLKRFVRFKGKKPIPHHEFELSNDEEHPIWWGTFTIEEEQSRYFKIGNIILCLDRYNHEWHITSYLGENNFNAEMDTPKNKRPFKSFAAHTSNEISLRPVLPDRALLAHLDRSFYIPPTESLSLYFSSPLWICVETGQPPITVEEISTEILSDTWFGTNTLEGELCYANHVFCSARLEDIPQDRTRIITSILIVNRSKETLLLKELKLPMPYLSIYTDHNNRLWTENLVVSKENHDYLTSTIIKGSPKLQGNQETQFLAQARFPSKSGFIDLFTSLKWT